MAIKKAGKWFRGNAGVDAGFRHGADYGGVCTGWHSGHGAGDEAAPGGSQNLYAGVRRRLCHYADQSVRLPGF